MEEHQRNALVVGEALSKSPHVESVRHPGMASHPQVMINNFINII